jgi:hypothetical protein
MPLIKKEHVFERVTENRKEKLANLEINKTRLEQMRNIVVWFSDGGAKFSEMMSGFSKDMIELLNMYGGDNVPVLKYLLEKNTNGIQRERDRLNNRMEGIKLSIKETLEWLETHPSKKSPVLVVEEIEKSLSRFSGYKKRSFTMGTRSFPSRRKDNRSYTYARFICTGLKMKPSENIFEWLNNKEPVQIGLHDIEVIINLDSSAIWIANPGYAIPQKFGKEVHPHYLGEWNPCLGDFTGGILTAIEDYDFVMVFANIKAFLEQANAYDSAGRNWIIAVLDQLEVLPYSSPNGTLNRNIDLASHLTLHSKSITNNEGDDIKVRIDNYGIVNNIEYEEILPPEVYWGEKEYDYLLAA